MADADPVQAQLDAYNRHSVDDFLACYSPTAQVRHADGRVLMDGREAMRKRYERLFADHPDVRAEVPTRIRAGVWVVDEERVQLGDQHLHVVVAYEVRNGLIQSVVMMRSDM